MTPNIAIFHRISPDLGIKSEIEPYIDINHQINTDLNMYNPILNVF